MEADSGVGDVFGRAQNGKADAFHRNGGRPHKGKHDVQIMDHKIQNDADVRAASGKGGKPMGFDEAGLGGLFLKVLKDRVKSFHVADLKNLAPFSAEGDQFGGLGRRLGHRFFDEDVFVLLQEIFGNAEVSCGGSGDAYGLGFGGECLQRSGNGNSMFFANSFGGARVLIVNPAKLHNAGASHLSVKTRMLPPQSPNTDDGHLDRFCHTVFSLWGISSFRECLSGNRFQSCGETTACVNYLFPMIFAETILSGSAAFVSGYLLGSIPFGYLLGRWKGVDLHQKGSGNIGAANAVRVLGKPAGFAVLILDAFKGMLACWLASSEISQIAAGLAAVLGHNFPCWLRFQGGKGIATSAGVLLILTPKSLAIAVGVFLILTAATRIVSVGSLGASVVLPFAVWIVEGWGELLAVTALMGLLAVYQHRDNIRRLRTGTEPRLGEKKKGETPPCE